MKLTDTFLRSIRPTGKVLKLSDGGGLYMYVSPVGGKLWRMAYRYKGKQKTLCFGAYPAVSLKDARQKRDEAKEQLAHGIDPSAHKKAVKAAARARTENTFEIVAREWIEKQKDFWVKKHFDTLLSRLELNIFPVIGGKPVNEVSAPALLEAVRRIEARGAVETARRVLQSCGQVFRYAVATGRAESDPSGALRGALVPIKRKAFSSIKEPKEIAELLRDIDAYPSGIVRDALRMAAYVFVRPGELRRAEWTEFDIEAAEWRIPAAKMKMRELHIVPLSKQVLSILEGLRIFTGDSRYLFPSMRANSAPISDMTLLAALRRLGYGKEQMTVHGFRSMASTLLNERGFNRDWIERQLAHGDRNGIRAAYNYAEYLPERRIMMQAWADYLDRLREGKIKVKIHKHGLVRRQPSPAPLVT
ncbi:MAG: integrase arm-type DNA-binding domain-containing protein [Desulfovibrio sp.]|jgi:integrase|nr:integrase arm-type DNA-binding domain-containing protein [Desulfovibrio sp.]